MLISCLIPQKYLEEYPSIIGQLNFFTFLNWFDVYPKSEGDDNIHITFITHHIPFHRIRIVSPIFVGFSTQRTNFYFFLKFHTVQVDSLIPTFETNGLLINFFIVIYWFKTSFELNITKTSSISSDFWNFLKFFETRLCFDIKYSWEPTRKT